MLTAPLNQDILNNLKSIEDDLESPQIAKFKV